MTRWRISGFARPLLSVTRYGRTRCPAEPRARPTTFTEHGSRGTAILRPALAGALSPISQGCQEIRWLRGMLAISVSERIYECVWHCRRTLQVLALKAVVHLVSGRRPGAPCPARHEHDFALTQKHLHPISRVMAVKSALSQAGHSMMAKRSRGGSISGGAGRRAA
ncbi:hypothetical protein CBM2598_U10093 [Cupriavidus taiwanensis]|uniref:Uncharacterized protein n=1 Tax=Cupriavidus taiwanensis TaxID=164546 RepID=A0A7Z7JHM9_9BURK|nr:hypothetical protein CBM2597_U10258 [Cupriavidus taiwanensis]SOZ96272.1 hypothetical protein CBM2598_U10093 [Cupriavidus taiwanensis]SPC25763.1 hypothetical protein CBM2594_U10264 [Cupriavidus taiwanensis]